MGLTKAKIIELIYSETYFTKREATSLLETLLDIIKEDLSKGEKIKIQGFGSFVIQAKNSRPGRNPRTGKRMIIPPRKAIKFKASDVLKDDILQRYAYRIDKNGQENTSLPPRKGAFEAFNHFVSQSTIKQEEE